MFYAKFLIKQQNTYKKEAKSAEKQFNTTFSNKKLDALENTINHTRQSSSISSEASASL